jgi:hypothetical protein
MHSISPTLSSTKPKTQARCVVCPSIFLCVTFCGAWIFLLPIFHENEKSHHFERSCNFREKGTHGVMLSMPMSMEHGVMFDETGFRPAIYYIATTPMIQ